MTRAGDARVVVQSAVQLGIKLADAAGWDGRSSLLSSGITGGELIKRFQRHSLVDAEAALVGITALGSGGGVSLTGVAEQSLGPKDYARGSRSHGHQGPRRSRVEQMEHAAHVGVRNGQNQSPHHELLRRLQQGGQWHECTGMQREPHAVPPSYPKVRPRGRLARHLQDLDVVVDVLHYC